MCHGSALTLWCLGNSMHSVWAGALLLGVLALSTTMACAQDQKADGELPGCQSQVETYVQLLWSAGGHPGSLAASCGHGVRLDA